MILIYRAIRLIVSGLILISSTYQLFFIKNCTMPVDVRVRNIQLQIIMSRLTKTYSFYNAFYN